MAAMLSTELNGRKLLAAVIVVGRSREDPSAQSSLVTVVA
jgi:hypothetical protein